MKPIEEDTLIAKLRDAYVAKPINSETGYEAIGGYEGRVMLFGFIPIKSGLYAANEKVKLSWQSSIRLPFRLLSRIQWKEIK